MTTATKLTSSDRRELGNIIKRRIALMNREIKQREQEIRTELRAKIELDKKKLTDKYATKLSKLKQKAAQIEAEGNALQDAARKEGIVFGQINWSTKRFREDESIVGASVVSSDRMTVDGIDDQIQMIMERVVTEKGRAGVSLEKLEVDLLEKLHVGAITSDEGKAFLDAIPSIDEFLSVQSDEVLALLP